MTVPEIDVSPLVTGHGDVDAVGRQLDAACREVGFFAIVGHRADTANLSRLDALAREFFARPDGEKTTIDMAQAGRAWRGWFPLGGELTAGRPDQKEGLYFGTELGPDDPRVQSNRPLHGANLFPRPHDEWRTTVLDHLADMTRIGQAVLAGLARGLGLAPDWFRTQLTGDPTILFRIFRYPPATDADDTEQQQGWGVGEHTDYGLLTVLVQDGSGGLQVRMPDHTWIDVDPHPERLVCNLGDMLERLTGGQYRSTPHRVRNTSGRERLSFPFFLDPAWDAVVDRLPIVPRPADDASAAERWDRTSVHGFTGPYGEYLLTKVGKVFPALVADAM